MNSLQTKRHGIQRSEEHVATGTDLEPQRRDGLLI
jgi:hypothetical protein